MKYFRFSIIAAIFVIFALYCSAVFADQLAFPQAEGFGRFAKGGRAGKVLFVTNLNDAGPGSLREAVESDGPRTIIFRVSGNIQLKSVLTISKPYVTIAGQTAPGDGICLADFPTRIRTHDVVIRYMRFRLGDKHPGDNDALGGGGCENVIIDHCSASWSIDECVSFYRNNNVTIQWCIISESLCNAHHVKGPHGYGGIWGGNNTTFHHNLLAHHSSRNPRFDRDENVDHRNNVIYNWGFNSAYGGERCRINMIANYYKPGPATDKGKKQYRIVEPYDTQGRWYVADNYVYGNPKVSADNWAGGVQAKFDITSSRVNEPFPAAPVKTHTAEQAYKLVLAHAGDSLPGRDSIDTRIIEEVRTGTARYGASYKGGSKGIIDSQKDVGSWPELKSAKPPKDNDRDGMADDWEISHGLNPADPSDASKDRNADGYTNIEEYINSLAAAERN